MDISMESKSKMQSKRYEIFNSFPSPFPFSSVLLFLIIYLQIHSPQ